MVKTYLGAWGEGVVSKKKKKKVKVNVKKKCQWSKVTRGLGVLLLGSKMIVYQHDSAPHEENVEIQNFFLDIFLFTLAVIFYANSSYI